MNEIQELKKLNQSGVSMEEMAREIGVSYQQVWRWIHEINRPSQLAKKPIQDFLKRYSENY